MFPVSLYIMLDSIRVFSMNSKTGLELDSLEDDLVHDHAEMAIKKTRAHTFS
jgi:hypothetical protein